MVSDRQRRQHWRLHKARKKESHTSLPNKPPAPPSGLQGVSAMTDNAFFDEPTEASLIKARIVSDYLAAWARVIGPSVRRNPEPKIAYVDLLAGRGRYRDGTPSTPLLVLQKAVDDPELGKLLSATFGDKDAESVKALDAEIAALPGVEALKYKPARRCLEVGSAVVQAFSTARLVPTLLFVDPWGYKGLTLELINSVIKDWACECIFFFNFNRINAALTNDVVKRHVDGVFGKHRADALREAVAGLRPHEREAVVVDELLDALKDVYRTEMLKYRFVDAHRRRTSHYLVFVTKHPRGYGIMKDIMAAASSTFIDGVPSYEYNPRARIAASQYRLGLEEGPLEILMRSLLDRFRGGRLRMREIFEQDNIGKPYILANYKEALRRLEAAGQISAEPPAARRIRKGVLTFGDTVYVTFPAAGGKP